jgi:hypothetical protein
MGRLGMRLACVTSGWRLLSGRQQKRRMQLACMRWGMRQELARGWGTYFFLGNEIEINNPKNEDDINNLKKSKMKVQYEKYTNYGRNLNYDQ